MPEWDLLVQAARVNPSPDWLSAGLGQAPANFRWGRFFELARGHGVAGLVSKNLAEAEWDDGRVPDRTRTRFLITHRSQGRSNLAMTACLGRILDAFHAEGVPVIPMKGPVLAAQAYGDVSLRAFGDLDVLVRKEDIGVAPDLLRTAGLTIDRAAERLLGEGIWEWGNALPFLTLDRRPVELHWRLTQRYWRIGLSTDDLWRRSRELAWNDHVLRGFSPEDHLLFLCVHGSRHAWERLIWVCDVAETLQTEGVDWDLVIGRAEETGTRRMLFLGLALGRRLLGAPLPGEIVLRMRAERALDGLVDHTVQVLKKAPVSSWSEFRYHTRTRDTVGKRFGFVLSSLFTPSQEDVRGAPQEASNLALRIRRPFRLARKYWGRRRGLRGWK